MSSTPIPRSSIHASQYAVVDSQLKSLKLITRRLQSVVKIHDAELLILQRLFYKNKNQHRSALFWRSVSELRRYSQRVASLELLDNLQSLRFMFHNAAATSASEVQSPNIQRSGNSARGSWSCFPNTTYLVNLSVKLDVARKLTERMSEACSKAYNSFNRSLQSGAFLSILLTFVAISSRLKTVSLELRDICDQSLLCISRFLVVHEKSLLETPSGDVTVNEIPEGAGSPSFNAVTSQALEFKITQEIRATVILERIPQEVTGRGEITQPKKKRKIKRNEIDDIFGS